MILGLVITLLVFTIGLWLLAMYAWWKKETAKETGSAFKQIDLHALVGYWGKAERLARRGYYGGVLFGKHTIAWGNQKLSKAFFTLFPKAQHAFEKRDMLTGLETGPTSYFLLSITEAKAALTKPRRKKKIV